jgi:hypothetical protein
MTTTTLKADRVSINRAPKGGMVSPINGLFYKGGQFMPAATAGFNAGPATLEGSSRQVAWATRLRDEALVKVDDMLATAHELLKVAAWDEAPAIRAACRDLAITRHLVKAEKSAAKIIGWQTAPMF